MGHATARKPLPLSERLPFIERATAERIHSEILFEFVRSGLTVDELAKRIGQKSSCVRRWLERPEELNTLQVISDLFLGLGCEPHFGLAPLKLENLGSKP